MSGGPRDPFYITTPIYYVNDHPHIGHTYTTVIADVISRFRRMEGREVRFLTGTDEHGQKIERAAKSQNLAPKALADKVVARYHTLWKKLGITFDDFIRTTDDRHIQGVLKIFDRIKDTDDVYLDTYEGHYCVRCEAFFPESQLVDGGCPDFGHSTERLEEESYFFRLSRYQEPLLRHYREHPEFVEPEVRRNEVVRFVEMGLRDLSISRTSFTWGIPFPGAPRHIFYVWFDALCNYMTALDYTGDSEIYQRFWPADVHLVGKDILRFHAVYWPAFLMAAQLPLPRTIWGHGWWLRAEGKMSKTTGNVVDPLPLIEAFGSDELRYFLLREMAFGQDAQFSEEGLIDRINTDLANDLGNLVSRLLTLVGSSWNGAIPPLAQPGPEQPEDLFSLRELGLRELESFRRGFDDYRFHEGLASLWSLVSGINRFLVRWEPWALAKDPARRDLLGAILREAAEGLATVALAVSPVMPEAAQDLWKRLGGSGTCAEHDLWRRKPGSRWGLLQEGRPARRGEPLFPRIDKLAYFKEEDMTSPPEKPSSPETPAAPAENLLSIQDFQKIQLRTGKVIQAEKVAGADRLLKLTVDVGTDTRTIVAGIALQYAPEALVGKTLIIVVNLKPARLRGVESQGMLLAADVDGKPIVATFEEEVPAGSDVR
jgi:methionyl-tRNA synthetase